MIVQVQFFSHLKEAAGLADLEVEVPSGARVSALLELLYARMPELRAWNSSILIGAGVEFVGRDYALQPNEEISIMPPVQGG